MAASSYGRHTDDETLWYAKRTGGLDFLKSRRFKMGARICLLYDGFFSFAVVRQVFLLFILLCYMDDYGN